MKTLKKIFVTLALCALITPAIAATQLSPPPQMEPVKKADLVPLQPFNVTGIYTVSWGGVDVGNLVLHAREDATSYHMRLVVKSYGLAKLLTRHQSTSTIDGIKDGERYLPSKFETDFKLRGDTRHIILTYDKTGTLVDEYNVPPEKRWKRPEVPMELKQNVPDIISMLFIQRAKIYEALKGNEPEFTIRSYDGRRLTDVVMRVTGRKTIGWSGQKVDVIAFNVKRKAVAGYKDSEIEKLEKDKDPNVEFYLRDDGSLTPLKIVVDADAGVFYANLTTRCETLEECLKKM